MEELNGIAEWERIEGGSTPVVYGQGLVILPRWGSYNWNYNIADRG